MTVDFDTRECRPWAPINNMFSNMTSFDVKIAGVVHEGSVTLSTDNRHVTIEFLPPKKDTRKPRTPKIQMPKGYKLR